MFSTDILNEFIEQSRELNLFVKEKFKNLDSHQLNWRPGNKRWSAGECFKHLVLLNNRYIPGLKTAAIPGQLGNKNDFKFGHSIFGRMILFFVKPGMKIKSKTSFEYNTLNSRINEKIVAEFLELNEELIELAKQSFGADLKSIKIVSPLSKLIKYNAGDTYRIIWNHNKRHVNQAERVLLAPGFPARKGW